MPPATDLRVVRPARRQDAPDLALVEARAWTQAYGHLLPVSWLDRLVPAQLERRWQQRIAEGDRVVVHEDRRGRVIGYATFGSARDEPAGSRSAGFAGEVYEVYVDPDHQRTGVGRALLAHCRAALAARYYWWVIEVLRDNHAARAFYGALGLQTDARVLHRPLGGLAAPGRRYSRPVNAVPVVRYEGPLVTLDL